MAICCFWYTRILCWCTMVNKLCNCRGQGIPVVRYYQCSTACIMHVHTYLRWAYMDTSMPALIESHHSGLPTPMLISRANVEVRCALYLPSNMTILCNLAALQCLQFIWNYFHLLELTTLSMCTKLQCKTANPCFQSRGFLFDRISIRPAYVQNR